MPTGYPKDPGTITSAKLKDLGLYTPFSVSKWCIKHGIQSVYVEHQRVKYNQVGFQLQQLLDPTSWVVRDAAQPGKDLFKVTQRNLDTKTPRDLCAAWVEANYDTPTKWVSALRGSFPTPAVELLKDELRLLYRVWSPETEVRESVPVSVRTRFLSDYPTVPRSLPALVDKDLVIH
jgi:hypothetical protein